MELADGRMDITDDKHIVGQTGGQITSQVCWQTDESCSWHMDRLVSMMSCYDRQKGYMTDIGTDWSWSWYDGQMIDLTDIWMDMPWWWYDGQMIDMMDILMDLT